MSSSLFVVIGVGPFLNQVFSSFERTAMGPLSFLLLLGGALLAAASPAPTANPDPAPDCALIDCASGLKCVMVNNTAACIPPRQGPQCGPNRCALGETCCNPSCGMCTPPGKGCIKLFRQSVEEQEPSKEPNLQLGTKCGPNVCASDEHCCNESCGYCRKPGTACTEEFCINPPQQGPKCGPTQCAAGEACCNESCGYCTKPGQKCTKEFCAGGPTCGPKQCAFGEFCCNDSCGYCKKPGQTCTMELCVNGPRCGPNQCAYGEVCCNESCGYCRTPGQGCTKERCLIGEKCGDKTCSVGEKCCDPFCGTCVKEGWGCGAGCPRKSTSV